MKGTDKELGLVLSNTIRVVTKRTLPFFAVPTRVILCLNSQVEHCCLPS